MRRHHPRFLVLTALVLAVPAACSPDGEVEMDPDQPTQAPGAQPPPPDHTITIGWDASLDTPTISVDELPVYGRGRPVVAWAGDASLGNRSWLVAFGGPTPFRNGQRVFDNGGPGNSGTRGPINPSTPLGNQYKYWVWVTDDDGDWVPIDPRLRIVDDPGDTLMVGANP